LRLRQDWEAIAVWDFQKRVLVSRNLIAGILMIRAVFVAICNVCIDNIDIRDNIFEEFK
jgi:hypothetical protein